MPTNFKASGDKLLILFPLKAIKKRIISSLSLHYFFTHHLYNKSQKAIVRENYGFIFKFPCTPKETRTSIYAVNCRIGLYDTPKNSA